MKKQRSQDSRLIFDWRRRERRGTWLLACFLVTLLGLASLFLIFRIVTPEAPKLTSRPQQMIVLNPDVPAERALIHHAQDRSFTLVPSDTLGEHSLPKEVRLPAFKATISTFEMKLKSAGSRLTSAERPSLMQQDFLDVLPPPPKPESMNKPAPLPRVILRAQLDGSSTRPLLAGRDLPEIPLTDPARPRFRIAVGSLGQVVMAMPVASSDDPAVMVKLHAAMTQLRFQPQPQQKDLEWLDVSFGWEKEGRP
jgi:hypothetical protein